MAGRRLCPKCDAAVPVGARECPECGARLVKRTSADRDDDDRPRSRDRIRPRTKKREKTNPLKKFLIPALVGGVVVFAGLVGVIVWASGLLDRARSSDSQPKPERTRTALNEFEPVTWAGICAAKNTPPAVVERIQREVAKVLATPEIAKRLTADGLEPVGSTPEQFRAFLAADKRKWGRVVKDAGVKAE